MDFGWLVRVDTNANANSNSNTDAYSNAYPNSHSDANTDSNTDSNSHAYSNTRLHDLDRRRHLHGGPGCKLQRRSLHSTGQSDGLCRSWLEPCFDTVAVESRRLLRHAYSDANANTDSNSNSNSHPNAYSNTNSDAFRL